MTEMAPCANCALDQEWKPIIGKADFYYCSSCHVVIYVPPQVEAAKVQSFRPVVTYTKGDARA